MPQKLVHDVDFEMADLKHMLLRYVIQKNQQKLFSNNLRESWIAVKRKHFYVFNIENATEYCSPC